MAEIPRLSDRRKDLEVWTQQLPSVLAVPLARLEPQLDKGDNDAKIAAARAAVDAAVRFTAYVCAADVLNKLRADDPFLSHAKIEAPLAAIARVIDQAANPDALRACIAAVFAVYADEPKRFFAPELIAGAAALTADTTKLSTWPELDAHLGAVFQALAPLVQYELAQLHCLPRDNPDGGVIAERYLRLRGYHVEEKDLTAGPLKLPPVAEPWRMRQLYLFGGDREHCLLLHPFVLFQLEAGSFLFNGLDATGLRYASDRGELHLGTEEDERAAIDVALAPIHRYFVALRALSAGGELSTAHAHAGKSKALSFQRTVDFHAEGFSGRSEYFEKIDHAIAGPFRCVWIRGFAGYGKSALMARLSQQHPESIIYFISPERGAADASTFLRTLCEKLIERFGFSDVLNDEQLGSPKDLKRVLDELLPRAVAALPPNQKLVLLIDGLDESQRYASSPEEVIDAYLPENRDAVAERVVFIITSRPEEVNLSHLADITLDLQPFSRDQVVNILGKYGWNEQAAAVAYTKSDGQPIYFRFLLDEAKRGAINAEMAMRLPDGIVAFYQRFWDGGGDERRTRLDRDLLAFLAAAAEPLTEMDLLELESGLDPAVTRADIRAAFEKERLGRFVIGSRRFSLFHDTLRAFTLQHTRPDDALPYGNGQRYHEMLARWCAQATSNDYADSYRVFHLLHAREYTRALDVVSGGDAEQSLVKRRMGERRGSQKLTRDLAYAIAAARELNDLDRIFGLTLLQISMKRVKKTAVIPEAVGIMSSLGMNEDLAQLLEGGDNDRERWDIAAKVYSHFLARKDLKGVETWLGHLRRLWMNAQSYSRTELLISLLQRQKDERCVDVVLASFDDIEASSRARTYAEGLAHLPALAAKRLLALDTRKSDDWYISDRLAQIALDLVAKPETAELAWQVVGLFSLRGLDAGMIELRALMAKDPQRLLQTLRPAQFQVSDWSQVSKVVGFARMLHALAPASARDYVSRAHVDVKLTAVATLAMIGGRDDLDHAAAVFEAECGLASTVAVLGALAMLILAHERLRPGEPCLFAQVFAKLDGLIRSSQGALPVDDAEVQKELKVLLPRAARYAAEIEAIFPSKQGALWFALAAASEGFDSMLDERLRTWLQSKASERAGGSEQVDALVRALTPKLAERMQYTTGVAAVQGFIAPVFFALAPLAAPRKELVGMGPFAQVGENDAGAISAEFWSDPAQSAPLYPVLMREGGYPMSIDTIRERALVQIAYVDPAAAMRGFRVAGATDMEKVKEADHVEMPAATAETFASDRPFSVNLLLRAMFAADRAQDGYEILLGEPGMWEGWRRFSERGEACFSRMLDELPAIAQKSVSDDLLTCVTQVLDRIPQEDERKRRVQALLQAGLPSQLVLTLVGYAFRRGMEQEALGFLDAQVRGDASAVQQALSGLLVPWVEAVLERSETQAGEMWEQMLTFLRSRSLEFLAELQSSFDAKISAALVKKLPGEASLAKIARVLPTDFVSSRRTAAAMMVKAGAGQEQVEPLLDLQDLVRMIDLLRELGPTDPPAWLRAKMWGQFQALLRTLDVRAGWLYPALTVWLSPWWSDAERGEARALMESGLASAVAASESDDERVEYDEWRKLLDAIARDDFSFFANAGGRAEQLAYKAERASKLNPRLGWKMLGALPPEWRETYRQDVFYAGVRFNPAWAVGEFAGMLNAENARDMMYCALHNTPAEQWHVIEGFVRAAVEAFPGEQETWSIQPLMPVVRHSLELAGQLIAKHKDPMFWAELFGSPRNYGFVGASAPTPELFAHLAQGSLQRWAEQIRAFAADARIEPWGITQKLKPIIEYLRQAPADLRARCEGPLFEAMEHVIEERKANREQLLGELLRPMAAFDTERALRWVARWAYKGHLLNDILREVLRKRPAAIEEVYESVLKKSDEWARRSTLIACLTEVPLADALRWVEREGLEPEEFAFMQAKHRVLDDKSMAELERRISPRVDSRFKLYLNALQKAGAPTTDVQRGWAKTVWEIYCQGRFVLNQYDQIGFSIPVGSSRVDLQACKLEYSIVSPK